MEDKISESEVSSASENDGKKELKRWILKRLPLLLVLAAILTVCIVIVFSGGEKPKKKKHLTYTVRGINKFGDAMVAEYERDDGAHFLSEDDWEAKFAVYAAKTEKGRPEGNRLEFTYSNLPDVVVRLNIARRGNEHNLTVIDRGDTVMTTKVAINWKEGDASDTIWFCDLNNDGYPELLAGDNELTFDNTLCIYDIYAQKQYTLTCEKGKYRIVSEYDSVAVWLEKWKTVLTPGDWPYAAPERGTLSIDRGQPEFVLKDFPFAEVPTAAENDSGILRWFDLDQGDEAKARAIRLPEYPDATFVAEKGCAYCRMSSGEEFLWLDSEVTEAYFYDIDGDGKREMFFAEIDADGNRLLWWWGSSLANGKTISLLSGRYLVREGELLAARYENPETEQPSYMLHPLYIWDKVVLVRELGAGEVYSWAETEATYVRLQSEPNILYDPANGLIYRATEEGYEESKMWEEHVEEYNDAVALNKRPGKIIKVGHTFESVFRKAYFIDLDGDGVQEMCGESELYVVQEDGYIHIEGSYGNEIDRAYVADVRKNRIRTLLPVEYKFMWIDKELWVVTKDYNNKGAGERIGRPVIRNGELQYIDE